MTAARKNVVVSLYAPSSRGSEPRLTVYGPYSRPEARAEHRRLSRESGRGAGATTNGGVLTHHVLEGQLPGEVERARTLEASGVLGDVNAARLEVRTALLTRATAIEELVEANPPIDGRVLGEPAEYWAEMTRVLRAAAADIEPLTTEED